MKYKKILFFSCLIGISLIFSSQISTCNPSLKKYTPENSIIAWDFHSVLVQRQPWEMAKHLFSVIWSDHNPWQLIKVIPYALYDAYDLYYRRKMCTTYEEIIEEIATKYPAIRKHKIELLDIMTFYIPLYESIALLEQLKQDGYRNFLASNMGEFTYNAMKQKYPDIFVNLEGIFLPQVDNENFDVKIGKPCFDYFQAFRAYLMTHDVNETITIIFIDDKQENIDAANKSNLNIHGILFRSAHELKQIFNQILEIKPSITEIS
jgi:FMN phosphatase YigB (HAD superfamily)